jgi:hypothetical protein
MSQVEIGSPEFDLMEPKFYAQRGVGISAISPGQFRGNFVKSDSFDMQEFNNMTLSQFH